MVILFPHLCSSGALRVRPATAPAGNLHTSVRSTMEARIGNVEHAREVYRRGIAARCSGAASVWQGFGALEASLGDRDTARQVS